ncbi:ABC transporter substrate-binding protein [Pollutimonas bauzanensis]|uniref:Iron complex transport system substrate-binding protein n=1 Tax=Pollutimonas bauzanensis TaxID=658167 RepID=A0A1M5R8X8_9BURK|nr:ABC transporter substrate-binding protein [Pollutimonas bauzanensis]SHH22785.1 iron complex transport system substrate-binding protein [Pollutimonas bauzanensis]
MQPAVRMSRAAGLAVRGLAILGALALVPPAARAQAGPEARQAAESRPAARAITLAPHITELIFAAGAGDKIVATVTSSDYPPAALAIPRTGDGVNISVEKTLALRPDLVVAWHPAAAAATLAPALARLDIPLRYSAPDSLRDIPAEIIRFGKIFDTEAIAGPAAQALAQRLQTLSRRYAWRKPVSVFIEVGSSPLYTIGDEPVFNDALRICGGVNIYAGATAAAPQVSTEAILVAQPQVVITPAADAARLEAARSRWSQLRLPAALRGHIYGIDPDKLFRPGPRLIDAAEELCGYLEQAR